VTSLHARTPQGATLYSCDYVLASIRKGKLQVRLTQLPWPATFRYRPQPRLADCAYLTAHSIPQPLDSYAISLAPSPATTSASSSPSLKYERFLLDCPKTTLREWCVLAEGAQATRARKTRPSSGSCASTEIKRPLALSFGR
jgi:hypothetical protein